MISSIKNLGDVTITTAVTDLVITESSLGGAATTYIGNLAGMSKLVAFANFVYGSNGTTAAAIIQTSLDQGTTWVDIIRFDFLLASRKVTGGVGLYATSAATAVSALGSEGVLNNVLGDRLRSKITTTGTYAGNTSLAVRVHVL